MKNLSGQESLWVALPILIVVSILIAGIILLPKVETDIRSKAATPTPSVITPTKAKAPSPEIICSDLYTPVCGINNKTYMNACEANLAGVTKYSSGHCTSPQTTVTASPAMRYYLPATN